MASVTGTDSGSGFGVEGTSTGAVGVLGQSDSGPGVSGASTTGSGVLGHSDTEAGVAGLSKIGIGVIGRSDTATAIDGQSSKGDGVVGRSKAAAGVRGLGATYVGVYAESDQDNGLLAIAKTGGKPAAFGYSNAGDGIGVAGLADNLAGIGVLGVAPMRGTGVVASGAYGLVADAQVGPGVSASSDQSHGIVGSASGSGACGLIAQNSDAGGYGVAGISGDGTGVYGQSNTASGVYGITSNGFSAGVYGVAENSISLGVYAHNSAGGRGMWGNSEGGTGIYGSGAVGMEADGSSFGARISGPTGAWITGGSSGAGAIIGASQTGIGLIASSEKGTGALITSIEGRGVRAIITQLGIAVHGQATNPGAPSTYAGMFDGDVNVNGTLRKTSSHFLIDHPLDPANKYLEHAAVESAERKNIYDGTVTLDAKGRAEVRLPAWFEALNADLRYQLTAVGRAAPDLHIAREVKDGRFAIAGGPPRGKVCWQVTGVRSDAWARANPLRVEHRKPKHEQGCFLYPELHDAPAGRSIAAARERRLRGTDEQQLSAARARLDDWRKQASTRRRLPAAPAKPTLTTERIKHPALERPR